MTIPCRAWAHNLSSLTGWKRNGAAFILGVFFTLTLAPFFLFPLIIPAFTGLYILVDSAHTRRRRFADGWWWWGFHMTGLYWFCVALLTDPEAFAWLIPFALFALTGVIAIYNGIACWLMSFVRVRGLHRLASFCVIWTVVEFARGHLLSGFPWNLSGYSLGFSTASLQIASLIGAYGMTWFCVALGTAFAALRFGRNGMFYAITLWGLFAAGCIWGQFRLTQANSIPDDQRYVEGVMLRLVQANISQPHKWDPKLQMEGLKENIHLTQAQGLTQISHVIWPETAVPYVMQPDSELTHILGSAIPEGTTLITGTLRSEGDHENWKIWNSMVGLRHGGAIVGFYDKTRLVPFGEFQPLRAYVPKAWMTPVGDTDFSRGQSNTTVEWPGVPAMMPLICYEAIFPELSFSEGVRPQLLLNITNDAWFGMSSGPYQHFQMNRMRAVEQGIPLVRVANTGISAVIDGYGQIITSLPLGTQGIIDSPLPKSTSDTPLFVKYHRWVVLLGFLGFIFALAAKNRK